MATIKKGTLTQAHEWWVHLRPYNKRQFWKGERRAAKHEAEIEAGAVQERYYYDCFEEYDDRLEDYADGEWIWPMK